MGNMETQKRTEAVAARLTPDEAAAVKGAAKHARVPVSIWVRWALLDQLCTPMLGAPEGAVEQDVRDSVGRTIR